MFSMDCNNICELKFNDILGCLKVVEVDYLQYPQFRNKIHVYNVNILYEKKTS